jgi:hypothetical protein
LAQLLRDQPLYRFSDQNGWGITEEWFHERIGLDDPAGLIDNQGGVGNDLKKLLNQQWGIFHAFFA